MFSDISDGLEQHPEQYADSKIPLVQAAAQARGAALEADAAVEGASDTLQSMYTSSGELKHALEEVISQARPEHNPRPALCGAHS